MRNAPQASLKGKTMSIRRVAVYVSGAALLIASAISLADSNSGALDEIVVTATKRDEKLHDVAMSITALSGNELALRQDVGFLDWAAQVPGLSVQSTNAAYSRLILRGQNVGSVGATVATTVDDIPFFMSGAQSNGAFFSANVDTYDLQRIEVLRGPQGTLYGAAAEGGIIKYVTNPPNLNKTEGGLSFGGQSVDGGSTTGNVRGYFNLPFWSDKAALRVSAVEQGVPGWIDNPGTGEKNANGGNSHSLRASLLVEPVADFTARLTVFDQHLNVDGDNRTQVVGAAATPQTPPANQYDRANGFVNSTGVTQSQDNDLKYAALNLNYDFKWANLTSATSYGKFNEHYITDQSNANLAPGFTYADLLGGIYNTPVLLTGDQTEYVHKFNQELRLTSDPGTLVFGHGLDWQLGAYLTHELTNLIQPFNVRDAGNPATILAPAVGGAVIPAEYRENSYFADITYHFNAAFDLEVGGRHTLVKQHSQVELSCCVLYGPANTYPALYSSESSTTWSAAPRWHINEDTLAYIRIATGFRPGGPNFPTPALPNPPTFRSDSTRNYEVGIRSDLFDKRFSIDMAVFYIDWKDIQILGLVQTSTGPIGINGNSGSATSKGVEWNFQWRPISGLAVGLLGSYTNAYLTSDAPGLGAFSGEKLPYVPNVSATLNVDYNWHAFGSFNAFAGGSETYTGTRYSDFSPSPTIVETHAKLPVYNTLQLHAGLDNGRYDAELYANNVTNSLGITHYANNGGLNQTGLATFIQPRTIGIELGVKF